MYDILYVCLSLLMLEYLCYFGTGWSHGGRQRSGDDFWQAKRGRERHH